MVARQIPINNKVFALSTFNFDLKWDVCKMVVRYEYLDSSVIFCPGIYLDSSVIILSGDIIWNHRYILSCIYTWKPALHSVRVYNLKTALYSVWVYNMKPALYSVRENTCTRALYSVRVYNMKPALYSVRECIWKGVILVRGYKLGHDNNFHDLFVHVHIQCTYFSSGYIVNTI